MHPCMCARQGQGGLHICSQTPPVYQSAALKDTLEVPTSLGFLISILNTRTASRAETGKNFQWVIYLSSVTQGK